MLEDCLLFSGGNLQNQQTKKEEIITLPRSRTFSIRVDVPKVHYGIFIRSPWYGQYQMVCM